MRNCRIFACTCLALAIAALPAIAVAAVQPVMVSLTGPGSKLISDATVAYLNAGGEMVKATGSNGAVVVEANDGKVVMEIDSPTVGFYTAEFVVPAGDKIPVEVAIDELGNVRVTVLVRDPLAAQKATGTESIGLHAIMGKVGQVVAGKEEQQLGPGSCPAGGSGDECNIPIVVSEGTFAGTTADNTGSTGNDTTCGGTGDTIDEWYCYTATCDGMATASTCLPATAFDTTLAVFDACGGAQIVCNDDTAAPECQIGGLNRKSRVTWAVTGGTSYFVRVSGFGGLTGAYELDISIGGGCAPPGPCPVGGAGDVCTDAISISDGTVNGSLAGNTASGTVDCGFGNTVDEWYCYVATCDGTATATTCEPGTNFDTILSVFDACGGTELDCNDDTAGAPPECSLGGLNRKSTISWPATAGTAYMIRVSGFNNASGTYDLTLSCQGAGGGSCPPGGSGDECNIPIVVSEGSHNGDLGDNTGSTGNDSSCGGTLDTIDEWYCYTASCDGTATATTCNAGTQFDTILAVYSACGGGEIVCNDDTVGAPAPCALSGLNRKSTVSWAVTSGTSYFIRVSVFNDDFAGQGGFGTLYQLDISCAPGGGGGGNDDCANATAIAGLGNFPFDNSAATTDGNPNGLCLAFGTDQIDSDVWYCWTSNCDDNVVISTVGLTGVDTRIAVYDGCACPEGSGILACNDDSAATLQSTVSFPATSGNTYLIRIGTFPTAAGGTGQFSIACVVPPEPICFEPPANCQDFVTDNASQSNDTAFRSADDFTPAADGSITEICWWGAYLPVSPTPFPDNFTVTYYNDGGGFPGTVHAGPFVQGAGLTVGGPVDTGALVAGIAPIWEYTGTHAPVAVLASDCYWIEVKNNAGGGATWFWEWSFSGNNRVVVDAGPNGYTGGDIAQGNDFAFCLDIALGNAANCLPPPAANDDCDDAIAIAGEGTFPFDNSAATTDGVPDGLCLAFGTDQIDNDVWFCWTAPCTSDVLFETCGLTAVDTRIAVYDGCTCPTGNGIIACNDDFCGLQSSLTFSAVAGNQYLLRIGNFPGALGGLGSFSLTCVATPTNDDCEDAIGPLAVPSVTPGTTELATTDLGFPSPCGSGSITSPGVWYTVVGTGNTMTASMCNGNTPFDAKLNVYCDVDCTMPAEATCVTGIDDFCGLQPQVSWCSQAGALYHILVHGFGGATGPFELVLSDDGAPCAGAIACIALGACCLPDGTCVDGVSQLACEAQGGTYQGDDSACGGGFLGYSISSCANAFEDISATGTQLALGDDQGTVVPIGFTFNFFGTDQANIAVCSNGYLTFGPTLTDFSNDPIPSAAAPNDMIAPLWDDFNPGAGGTVHHQTLGAAPNRRFIAQWTNVPQFAAADSNTFQAVLFEGSNTINFRYGAVTPEAFAGDYSIGVENSTGTEGASVAGNTAAQGVCHLVEPVTDPPIECPIPEPECIDCPPGTNALVDADGNNSGWCWTTNQPANVDIFVDDVVLGSHALIEISKDMTGQQSQFGLLPPILIDFFQVCEDADTVTMIFIADESITNITSHDWSDFHWILFDGPEAWFDVAASAGFTVFPPFTSKVFDDFLDSPTNNMAKRLSAFGGIVPRFTSFFPGAGTGSLKIGIDLSNEDPVSFTLKEVPTTDFINHLSINAGDPMAIVEVDPMDVFEAADGFGNFVRFFRDGDTVTLTAEAVVNSRPFTRWVVNGVPQPVGLRTITVDAASASTATARYQMSSGGVSTPIARPQ